MPKKVPFKVVYCSGWEDDYSPKDLEVRVELEVLTNFNWLPLLCVSVACFCTRSKLGLYEYLQGM